MGMSGGVRACAEHETEVRAGILDTVMNFPMSAAEMASCDFHLTMHYAGLDTGWVDRDTYTSGMQQASYFGHHI